MDWHIFLTFDDMSIVCPRRPCRGTVVEMQVKKEGERGEVDSAEVGRRAD